MHSKMTAAGAITFVVAVKSRGQILEDNFLASPCFLKPHPYQILIQENFTSAAKAYNDAIDRSINDLMIFCHQDVFLPAAWLSQLQRALAYLEVEDPNWGVLGCGGVNPDHSGWGHLYSTGLGITGPPFERPGAVQTLDEIVLILRKSSGLRFDDHLPHFHLYGTDICLRAAKAGRKNYVIDAFCVHNTEEIVILSSEFYECCRYIRRTWKDCLPIQTTCIRLTRFNLPVYTMKLREAYLRLIRGKEVGAARVRDVQQLIKGIGCGS